MAQRHYIPGVKKPQDNSSRLDYLDNLEKERREKAEFPKQVVSLAGKTIPSAMNTMKAIEKIETAKLLDSEILEMTDPATNKPIFVDNTFTDNNYVTNEIANATSPWTSKVKVNPALDYKEYEIAEMLFDKGVDPSTTSKLVSTEKPMSTYAQVSKGVSEGSKFSNMLESSESMGLTTQSEKIGATLGKAGTALSIGSGVYRVFAEDEMHEKIHGGIQALSPYLISTGPLGASIAAINFVWDFLD